MSASLLGVIEAAELPNPPLVLRELEREHGVTTKEELVKALSDPDGAQTIRTLWRLRLRTALGDDGPPPAPASTTAALASHEVGGTELLHYQVTDRVELLVLKGDLTASTADAIVNAANSQLMHGGGLARAIVRKGGSAIQAKSWKWISRHGSLNVGSAMSTSSGKLPCKYVIHTVGPKVSHVPQPTPEHAQQLRNAVWNALAEAARLRLRSVVIPGISTGSFGYPRDLGAREIVSECARFCREHESSSVRVIGLMNFDDPTVICFVEAVEDAAQLESWRLRRPEGRNSEQAEGVQLAR